MKLEKKQLRKYVSRTLSTEEFCSIKEIEFANTYFAVLDDIKEGKAFYIFNSSKLKENHLSKPQFVVFLNETSNLTAAINNEKVSWRQCNIAKLLFDYDPGFISAYEFNKTISVYSKELHTIEPTSGLEVVQLIYNTQTKQRENALLDKHVQLSNTIDAKMALVPELDEDFKQWVQDDVLGQFQYIFFTKEKSSIKAYCTHCSTDVEISEASHNKTGFCPSCGHRITFKNLSRSSSVVDSFSFYLFQNTSDGLVLQCFSGYKTHNSKYGQDYKTPCIYYSEDYRVFAKSETDLECFKKGHLRTLSGLRWCTAYSIYAPSLSFKPGMLYSKNLKKVLKGTYLENSKLETFAHLLFLQGTDYLKIPAPSTLVLSKYKLTNLLNDHQYYIGSGNFLDFKANTLHEVLKLSKKTVSLIKGLNPSYIDIGILRTAEKLRGSLTKVEVELILKHFNSFTIKCLKYCSAKTIINYIEKNFSTFNYDRKNTKKTMLNCLWRYWEALSEKVEHFEPKVFFPKDLRLAYTKLLNSNDNTIELTNDTITWATNELFKDTNFVFYTKTKNSITGFCSHCKETFNMTTFSTNETVKCPHCHTTSTLKNSKSCKSAFIQKKFSLLEPLMNQQILVRNFSVFKDFSQSIYSPKISFTENSRVVIDKNQGHQGTTFFNLDTFKWVYTFATPKMEHAPVYPGNLQSLKGTFAEYSMVSEISSEFSIDVRNYLCLYAKYPAIEYIYKMGMKTLLKEILEIDAFSSSYSSNKQYLSNKCSSAATFLNLSKANFKQLQRLEGGFDTLRYLQSLSKADLTVSDDDLVLGMTFLKPDELSRVIQETSLSKFYKYYSTFQFSSIYEKNNFIYLWTDYSKMCKAVIQQHQNKGKFIKPFPKFPKNLKEQHDIVSTLYETGKLEEKNKKIEALQDNWKKFDFIDKKAGFLVTHPKDAADFVNEGNALKHCVKRYIDDAISEDTTILFVRDINEPEKPLYTLEYKNNKVVQFRGLSNGKPSQEAFQFLAKWEKFAVKATSNTSNVQVS